MNGSPDASSASTPRTGRRSRRIAYLLESGEFFGGVKVMLMQAEALVRRALEAVA
jgi:hypothetical protein